jgi:hypothetical protein
MDNMLFFVIRRATGAWRQNYPLMMKQCSNNWITLVPDTIASTIANSKSLTLR